MNGVIDWNTMFDTWREQFRKEHGFYPEDDPSLARKGLSPKERLAEHMRAAEWGAKFAAKEGRPPNRWKWENQWYKRVYGFDPREIRKFIAPRPRGRSVPRPPRYSLPTIRREPVAIIPRFGF